jgi:hypothetical protein
MLYTAVQCEETASDIIVITVGKKKSGRDNSYYCLHSQKFSNF